MNSYGKKCIFIGIESDYKSFKEEYSINIELYKTDNSLEMLNAINSCELFVGNSSFCAALSIGIGKKSYIELNEVNNYLFFNDYTKYFL
mgnify:CR=1 FL=1